LLLFFPKTPQKEEEEEEKKNTLIYPYHRAFPLPAKRYGTKI
jgi:hypothetical protein